MSYSLTVDLHYGAGATGLTLAATFRNSDGTPNGAGSATFTEVGGGEYEALLTVPAGFQGWVRFSSNGGATPRGTLALNPAETEPAPGGSDPLTNPYPGPYADGTYGAYLRDKLGLIHVGQVVVSNPINPTTNVITLIRGDAYTAATRRLLWTLTGYPDLTGATVQLRIAAGDPIAGSVVSPAPDGSAQVVAVDLTPTQTAALAGQMLPGAATVVLASGAPWTFWEGYVDARGKAAT